MPDRDWDRKAVGGVRAGSRGCKMPAGALCALVELVEDVGRAQFGKEVLGLLLPLQHWSSFSFLTLSLPWHLRTAVLTSPLPLPD